MMILSTARLNYAARHRNVYFDSVGGDPYGKKTNLHLYKVCESAFWLV